MSGVVKKENIIRYKGIKTNNLKNINIEIEKNKIIGIAGPSGSGKSSLAYDTIYNISEYEEAKLRENLRSDQHFDIDSYYNIIPAIEVKQTNTNNNPRSTIATFLNLDIEFKKIFSILNNVSPTFFSFNNPKNACNKCQGLGYIYKLDEKKIIDEEKSLKSGAIVLWHHSTLGYEEKLLFKYAEDQGISIEKSFKNLSTKEKQLILYGKGEKKYKISYKAYGKQRSKSFSYNGILNETGNYLENINQPAYKQKIEKYTIKCECPECKGQRFNGGVLKYKFLDKSIGDLYSLEIEELVKFLKNKKIANEKKICKELNNIIIVLIKIVEANLGYLHLNRSIPTLSGGELQRLRLISVMNSQISSMMYIIDEPSSKLHVSEYEGLYQNFEEIKKRGNTIIYVEHNPYFLKRADKLLFIGPGAGEQGGRLIDFNPDEFKEQSYEEFEKNKKEIEEYLEFKDITTNNIIDLTIKIPKNSITGIYGISGSGKSSLAKYLANIIKESEYLTQKPLKGNINSTIGTYSGTLFKDIREEISKRFKLNPDILNFNSELGKCSSCVGKGVIKYSYDYGKEIEITCEDCGGKRYSKDILEKKLINGQNIYEILTTSITMLLEKKYFESKKIIEKLKLLQKLGLGHLNLFRPTNTLSGGEAQRVKLSDILGKKIKNKILFFDEPLSGLSAKDSIEILKIFRELSKQGATIIFIEHNILGIKACDYIIEMGPGKGKAGGKVIFSGKVNEFIHSENYKKYEEIIK